jgi:hypothetical protein
MVLNCDVLLGVLTLDALSWLLSGHVRRAGAEGDEKGLHHGMTQTNATSVWQHMPESCVIYLSSPWMFQGNNAEMPCWLPASVAVLMQS